MWVYDVNKNSHLKGRRRFKADLQDLEVLCAAEYEAHGLRLKSAYIFDSR
jgi:ubiquitin-conjugating enzyme E2 Q